MKKLHQLAALVLIVTFAAPSVHGQDLPPQEEEGCSSAYLQSRHAAHGSVYIPITILVGAAIWFGLADRNHKHDHSIDSQDALGSIDNSKRHSRDHSTSSYRRSSGYSRGSYCH